MPFVIVPGIDNSDEQHWQSIWEAECGPAATRIAVASWTSPDLDDWVGAIERAVRMARGPDVVLVAHSSGCWAAASWVANRGSDARGVFLVAPPDQHGDLFCAAASSFTAVVPQPLELPGLMVSSDNDPYCAPQVAEGLAADWGHPQDHRGTAWPHPLLEWHRQMGSQSCARHRIHRWLEGSQQRIEAQV
jgi:uncharacterized protein